MDWTFLHDAREILDPNKYNKFSNVLQRLHEKPPWRNWNEMALELLGAVKSSQLLSKTLCEHLQSIGVEMSNELQFTIRACELLKFSNYKDVLELTNQFLQESKQERLKLLTWARIVEKIWHKPDLRTWFLKMTSEKFPHKKEKLEYLVELRTAVDINVVLNLLSLERIYKGMKEEYRDNYLRRSAKRLLPDNELLLKKFLDFTIIKETTKDTQKPTCISPIDSADCENPSETNAGSPTGIEQNLATSNKGYPSGNAAYPSRNSAYPFSNPTYTSGSAAYPSGNATHPSTYPSGFAGYPYGSAPYPSVNATHPSTYPSGFAGYPYGSAPYPSGNATHPSTYPSGFAGYPYRSAPYPSGNATHPSTYPSGSAGYPYGSAVYTSGSTTYPSGSVVYPSGNASYPSGSTAYPFGNAAYQS